VSAFGGQRGHRSDLCLAEAAVSYERSNVMSDVINEKSNIDEWKEMLGTEISDESLEAAACAGKLGAYTEFAWCTQVACPG
jgi:hypothetical protein